MNVIEFAGGLGNQLFQYAFGRAQKHNGIDVRYDIRWYERYPRDKPPRLYRLDKFHTNVKVGFVGRRYFSEEGFHLNLLKKTDCNFKGYWQYYKYYENIVPILREEFSVKKEFHTEEFLRLKEEIITNNSTSIHVRRGDYNIPTGFGCLPFRYYCIALKHTEGDLYIFSDDMDWCKKYFNPLYFERKIIFVHLDDYLDLELMKLCKYNIIANSSFSWWAAYLNDNLEKVVVAPWHYLDEKKYISKGRYPEDWIKIIY